VSWESDYRYVRPRPDSRGPPAARQKTPPGITTRSLTRSMLVGSRAARTRTVLASGERGRGVPAYRGNISGDAPGTPPASEHDGAEGGSAQAEADVAACISDAEPWYGAVARRAERDRS
jgi:hypothetical protein